MQTFTEWLAIEGATLRLSPREESIARLAWNRATIAANDRFIAELDKRIRPLAPSELDKVRGA